MTVSCAFQHHKRRSCSKWFDGFGRWPASLFRLMAGRRRVMSSSSSSLSIGCVFRIPRKKESQGKQYRKVNLSAHSRLLESTIAHCTIDTVASTLITLKKNASRNKKTKGNNNEKQAYWSAVGYWATIAYWTAVPSTLITHKLFPQKMKTKGNNSKKEK